MAGVRIALPVGCRKGRFGQPITELVNETLREFAATSPCFWPRVAPIERPP